MKRQKQFRKLVCYREDIRGKHVFVLRVVVDYTDKVSA